MSRREAVLQRISLRYGVAGGLVGSSIGAMSLWPYVEHVIRQFPLMQRFAGSGGLRESAIVFVVPAMLLAGICGGILGTALESDTSRKRKTIAAAILGFLMAPVGPLHTLDRGGFGGIDLWASLCVGVTGMALVRPSTWSNRAAAGLTLGLLTPAVGMLVKGIVYAAALYWEII